MIDLHCHLLPGIDDGASTLNESLEMAGIAVSQGINKIAATHHFCDEKHTQLFIDIVNDKLTKLRAALIERNIGLEVFSGAEVCISPFLTELHGINKLCINNSRYMLLELPMLDIPQYTEDVVYHLLLKGIVPIIAHPERNMRIMKNPNLLHPLISMGALSQVTASSILGSCGRDSQKCAKILFNNKMAHFIATDAHSSKRRAPMMVDAYNVLSKWIGGRHAKNAVEFIPEAILYNKDITVDEPSVYKKKFSFFS